MIIQTGKVTLQNSAFISSGIARVGVMVAYSVAVGKGMGVSSTTGSFVSPYPYSNNKDTAK